jgi:hypothetical protein
MVIGCVTDGDDNVVGDRSPVDLLVLVGGAVRRPRPRAARLA